MRFRSSTLTCIALGLIQGIAANAIADTRLTADAGWGGRVRDGRWNPLFVTASTDKPRNVLLAIDWPTSGGFLSHIEQAFTIDASPRTFPLLVPVKGWAYQNAAFSIVDRESGKSLAHFPVAPGTFLVNARTSSVFAGPWVGISGSSTQLETMQSAVAQMMAAYLQPDRVPDVPMGFDSLDLLVLNGPNLVPANFGPAALSDPQQRAIVEWVRAGGRLVLWPGDGGFPMHSPLVDVLPATLGQRHDLNLADADGQAIGLPPGSKKMAAYQLDPGSGAEKIPLLNAGQAAAYARRLGLGRIVLAPFNLSELIIADRRRCADLWRPLVAGILPIDGGAGSTQPAESRIRRDPDRIERDAAMKLGDFLSEGSPPGSDGFGDIMLVLLGMMVIVGPADTFVLKWMGRKHWTWVTTTGWIAMIAAGTWVSGQFFKSDKPDLKTLRTIDQIGDETIASTDYVSFYSSRTRACDLKIADDGWWQPVEMSDTGGSPLTFTDIDFHQTRVGNKPQEMRINGGNLRLLRGDKLGPGAPMLRADLKIEPRPDDKGRRHVVGTISNLSNTPLKNPRVTVGGGSGEFILHSMPSSESRAPVLAPLAEIAPHMTVSADAAIIEAPKAVSDESDRYDPFRRFAGKAAPPGEAELWRIAADANARRGGKMSALVATEKFAIVHAETDHATPAVTLVGNSANERHLAFIRALVEIH